MFQIKKQLNNEGFTLIEMLVAVFIFSVALAALMGIAARGLKASRLAQDQVVADYLALEGIEVIRNLRDSAFLLGSGGNTWTDVFSQNGCLEALEDGSATSCVFELDGSEIEIYPCSAGNSCTLYFNSSSGIYRHFQSGTPLPNYSQIEYDRSIYLQASPDNTDEIIVTVDVLWPTGSVQYVESLLLWL